MAFGLYLEHVEDELERREYLGELERLPVDAVPGSAP
jgi:hypothetical protein